MTGFDKLNKEVVSIGLCTDCGMCAGVCPGKCLEMDYRLEEPQLVKKCLPDCQLCWQVCPGKDIPMLDLERNIFGRERGADEMLLGIGETYSKCHAADPEVRGQAGGGGMISALLIYALENDLIDGAVVVTMSKERPWVAAPSIATSRAEVIAAAQAKETLVPVDAILGEAVSRGLSRLAVVGLPCHIHGIRKAQMLGQPDWARDKIKYLIGLFCGQNYTARATEHIIGEWAELKLNEVAKLEYRAGEYPGQLTITTKEGEVIVIPRRAQRNSQQAHEHDRCVVCYDYANEVADISVGECYGLEMTQGAPGQSTAIVRTEAGMSLYEGAADKEYIHLEPLDMEDFFRGGFELKKHGGAYRIAERRRYGLPYPDFHLPMDYRSLPREINMYHPLIS